jgi:hypothetical protein
MTSLCPGRHAGVVDIKGRFRAIYQADVRLRERHAAGDRFRINVLFTGFDSTIAVIRQMAAHARGLNAAIEVWVPWIVPYPLLLNRPDVSPDGLRRRFVERFSGCGVECRVVICFCRDDAEGLAERLPPGGLVAIPIRREWWPFREWRIASRLRRSLHEVMLVRPIYHA